MPTAPTIPPDRGFAEASSRARNVSAPVGRHRRWHPARQALWSLLDDHVAPGSDVAVVGAGNGDDVPISELTRRCRRLDLIDIDGGAMLVARRRAHLHRRRVRLSVSDVTAGGADRAIRAALSGEDSTWSPPPVRGLPGGPYDVLLSDLLSTQLLYPGLLDGGLPGDQRASTLATIGPQITGHVVRRLHASAPDGVVVHLNDLLGWWPGHPQPFTIEEVLRLAEQSPSEALALADSGRTPIGTDPRSALAELRAEIIDTAMWRWPFAEHVDYLVVATVARVPT